MNHFNIITGLFKYLLILRFQLNLVSTQSVQNSLQSINITRSDNSGSSDKVSLLVVNATFCQDQNTIDIALSAKCNVVSLETDDSGREFCDVECVCNSETGSFIVHEKQCRDERELRQGCNFVFGSWSWNNSWVWNSQNDRLLTLYYEDGFGFGGGFNVSTEEYSECGYTSLSTYNVQGGWSVFTIPSDELFISFFKLRRYWHFYWLIENLSEKKRLQFEGKFMKMDITCENSNETNGIVEVTQISSCLVFKVTGNITHEYNMNSAITDAYPSATLIPLPATTNIPFQSTTEKMEPSVTTADLYTTSSIDRAYFVVTTSESDLVYTSSSVSGSSSVVTSSSALESSTVLEGSSALEINSVKINRPVSSPMDKSISGIESTPVAESSSFVQDNPQIQSSSVIESTPATGNSLALGSNSVINNPIIKSSTILQSSQIMKSSPGYNSRSVFISVAQSTQGVKPRNKNNQIGLILGIVVACSAVVVSIIAVIILTATSLYKSHVKRTSLIHDDVTRVSMAMKSFNENAPTHI